MQMAVLMILGSMSNAHDRLHCPESHVTDFQGRLSILVRDSESRHSATNPRLFSALGCCNIQISGTLPLETEPCEECSSSSEEIAPSTGIVFGQW